MVFTKVMQDITSRKEQEERLRQSLEEKSTLVREIHHRVKNNLQMIVSLLSLQSSHTEDPRVLAAFEETEGRVRADRPDSRAAVRLRGSERGRGRKLPPRARTRIGGPARTPDEVQLEVSVPEMVLPIERAIPVGLIANELLLNSFKHGLKQQNGSVSLSLEYFSGDGAAGGEQGAARWARLRVADSGPGLPPGFDPTQTTSMGYRLVTLLVRQLRARLEIGKEAASDVTIAFPVSAN